jgi:hypothetical protein
MCGKVRQFLARDRRNPVVKPNQTFMISSRTMKLTPLILLVLCVVARSVSAETNTVANAEQVRAECIQGRRHICGRVLEVTKSGLVIDSGYTSLLHPPFDHSWLTPSTATPTRPGAQVERAAPDSIAVGLVFLTDLPRRPKPHPYDYVSLIGYPCGQYNYVPVPGVTKTIRRFAAGLATAVRLSMEPKP